MNVPSPAYVLVALVVAILSTSPVGAADRDREIAVERTTPTWRYSGAGVVRRSLDHTDPDEQALPLRSSTTTDTTVLAAWTFGLGCNDGGWTSVDRTVQPGAFFHIDDFAGLGGGTFGRLAPLEGGQSLWCGLRGGQTQPSLCRYATLPGYGNDWNQYFGTIECLATTGDVVVDFLIAWDCEAGYDYASLQIDHCDDNWINIQGGPDDWGGVGSEFYSTTIADSIAGEGIRLRFRFSSDVAWSDEDGEFDTDGAVILDSLTVSDASGAVLPTERFETEAVGATATVSGNWQAAVPEGYGDFAAVFPGYHLEQEDPCQTNNSCVWAFISGSTADYTCGGYPGQATVPYRNDRDQFIWNEIWSPWVPLTGEGAQVEIAFDVYRDLHLDPLVFYVWHVRTRDGSLCPSEWKDRNIVHFGAGSPADWFRHVESIADLIEPGATEVQIALGVRDMCEFWCLWYGTGSCHSHAPLFDNVVLRRIQGTGPQWNVRDIDLFQDTFAADGTTTGTARIDAAIDIMPWQNPRIRPGDSTAVTVSDVEVGLAPDPYTGFGSAVYAYVSVWNGIDPYSGDEIVDDPFRWPVVDSLTHDGRTWHIVRMDTVFANGPARGSPEANRFCVDLNDELFVPGDTIMFVFGAQSEAPGSYRTYWTPFTATTPSLAAALDEPAECTILPAAGWKRGGVFLYVDGYNGRGAQPFFDTAFEATGVFDEVDRFDIRGPGAAANHPGARVVDVTGQLLPCYRAIVWNTGDIEEKLLGDGTEWNGKADDASMLLEFLDGLNTTGGAYLSGDNIASVWPGYSNSGIILRDTYIQHSLIHENHVEHGFGNSPLVIGDDGGPFHRIYWGPDTTHALSQCPDLNAFDVIEPAGPSMQLMHYDSWSSAADGAVIGQLTPNPLGRDVRVILSGFSFHSIRDDHPRSTMDRFAHMRDILVWLGLNPPLPSEVPMAFANGLAQNYPNPFNPATTIEFSLKNRARVTLRVYNVRGQLVKTLVDQVRVPGIVHRIEWNGENNTGERVGSGVYFYRLVTEGFTKTKKMVLLK